jgi:hypothetical protein
VSRPGSAAASGAAVARPAVWLDSQFMVNAFLPGLVAATLTRFINYERGGESTGCIDAGSRKDRDDASFAQILGKLYFLQSVENLRRILLDYGQKHPRPANAAFNAGW